MALIKCPDCKKKISDSVDTCPKCGCKVTEEDKVKAFAESKRKKKRSKIIALVLAVAVIGSVILVSALFIRENNRKEQLRIEQQRKEEEEKKKAEEKKKKNEADFMNAITDVCLVADDFRVFLGEKSELISNTWSNAIWKTKDKDTDKYTLTKNGKFRDFSDAVSDCVMEILVSSKHDELHNKFVAARTTFEEVDFDADLQAEYGEEKQKIDKLLKDLQSFYNLLSEPSGNYTDFTSNVNNMQYDIVDDMADGANALASISDKFYKKNKTD